MSNAFVNIGDVWSTEKKFLLSRNLRRVKIPSGGGFITRQILIVWANLVLERDILYIPNVFVIRNQVPIVLIES